MEGMKFDFDGAGDVFSIGFASPEAEEVSWWSEALGERPRHQQELRVFCSDESRQELVKALVAFYQEDRRWADDRQCGGSTEIRQWERHDKWTRLEEVVVMASSPEELAEANRLVLMAMPEILPTDKRSQGHSQRVWARFSQNGFWWPFKTPNPYHQTVS